MKHRIFAVYDTKAKAFLPPFILPEVAMAKRVFEDCVNSDDHQFGKHPGDYTLFLFGEFLDHESEPFNVDPKVSLGTGVEYLKFDEELTEGMTALKDVSAGGTS